MSEHGADPFDWVGATMDGKYQIDAVIGRGGFGVVYRAHHLGFDETVAIKCLRIPQTLSGSARDDFERHFLAEGRLLHQLSRATAGIVQALDVGAAVSPNKTWTPFIVLEWLEGQSLEANFAERRRDGTGGRSLRAAVEILDSAARALAVAHEQGIAHRDIKPDNLFLAEVGGRTTLKVLDFGIAKVVSESESFSKAFEETGASLQAFTARYGAPEQFSRRYGATGPWSDVFSLALVLVEAVVNHSALQGSDAAQLFIAAADTAHRPTLRAYGFDPGPAIDAVLEVALAVDPKQRYPDAGQFWDALLAALAQSGEVSFQAASPGGVHALTAFSREDVTRDESGALAVSGNPGSPVATELTASTPLGERAAAPQRRGATATRSRGLMLAASVLLAVFFAFWLGRSQSFTPEGVSSSQVRVLSVPSASGATQSGKTDKASSALDSGAAHGIFAGLPARDIAAGTVPTSNAWLDKFSVLRREDNLGLGYSQAFARCVDAGKTLCTESQWQRACDAFSEVGSAPSWTESLSDGMVVVRGGGSCAPRKLVAESEQDAARVGLCCDRAVAMTSSSMQKQFLSSTAAIVLRVEQTLNQRSIDGFLALAEEHVNLNEHARDKASLKKLLTQSFAGARDLVIVTDTCDVSVAARKVVKRSRRLKHTSYETTGWTAVCQQTRHREGKAFSAKSSYEFSATSKLRAIDDSEVPASAD